MNKYEVRVLEMEALVAFIGLANHSLKQTLFRGVGVSSQQVVEEARSSIENI